MKHVDFTIIKRELPLSLSVALFFLWLPLMTPHILSVWREQETLWGLRGLLTFFAVIGGFSVTLLVERFAPRASLRRQRFWACCLLMLATPGFLFLRLPSLAGLFALFLCAACMAVMLLPAIQSLRGERSIQVVLFAAVAGSGLAAAGQPVLDWSWRMWPQGHTPLVVAAAGTLLTGGMAVSRRFKQPPATALIDAPGLCVAVERARETRLFTFRCAGLSLSCAGTLLMVADLYAVRLEGLPSWHGVSPLLMLIAMGLLATAALWGKRWLFLYGTALGVLLGGLTLSSRQVGPLSVYFDMFFLFLGAAGLGYMMLESLCDLTAPVNRTCALGLGVAAFFLFTWLAADPAQLLWVGERLRRPGADLPLIEGLFLLLPLLIGFRGTSRRSEAREGPDSQAADGEDSLVPQNQLYAQLTVTEKKVYQLILMGYANQQMADTLFVSINTIKFHVKNILGKAGVTKKSQLMGLHVHMASEDGEESAKSYPV